MWRILNIFRPKAKIEFPPIGQLTYMEGLWRADTPLPPVDSRGSLFFEAGPDGPTTEQLRAFHSLCNLYAKLLPKIREAVYLEAAAKPDALLPGTRLLQLDVNGDCTINLVYGLYHYHPPSKGIDLLDHVVIMTIRNGQICDVLNAG